MYQWVKRRLVILDVTVSARELVQRVSGLPAFRALKYRDFRLLWVGAFLSFTGSVVQNVAQQDMVFDLTGSRAQLAMVSFSMMVPVSLFGPVLGVVADMYDKRKLLVGCMLASAVGPFLLGWAASMHAAPYWMFLAVAAVSGFVQCIEVPTRQSIVRSVVDTKDLAAAIPAQASTFNLARVIGPAVALVIILSLGPAFCFWFNALSYFALALAALSIKTDLTPPARRIEPIRDLVAEGFLYTFRHNGLRTLFIMEAATSILGTFYMSQMSAIAKEHLGAGKAGLSWAFASVGIGAMLGLITTASLSHKPLKPLLVRSAMACLAVCTILLAFVRHPAAAYPLMATMGACTIIQFNTTNTLFQLISPDNLRGRVISMHMWAISGLAPIGVFVFGYVSEWFGISAALTCGGTLLAFAFLWSLTRQKHVVEPQLAQPGPLVP